MAGVVAAKHPSGTSRRFGHNPRRGRERRCPAPRGLHFLKKKIHTTT